ncbi:hypothetical protein [Pseudomonas sp.]|uniref:hypothetical protein n=1 Tax=Pseudomonas sp. TaxID=306 RepID=UPI003D6F26F2
MAFAPYPRVQPPLYSRWLASGAVLLALVGAGSVLERSFIEPRLAVGGGVAVLLVWAVALMVRVLYYRFNHHNAQCYAEATEQQRQIWWQHHRQKAALIESVLVSAACSKPEQVNVLFSPDHQPPAVLDTGEGAAIRLPQVCARDVETRERELAVLLALKWQAQRTQDSALQPLSCYWLGSLAAWGAFVEQMALSCPEVCLPEHPESWQGIRSLDAIIDLLLQAPADARVLCAGCHSARAEREQQLPAGEAAVLWLLGAQGGVHFPRGEWFAADAEDLTTVAAQALKQSELEAPAPVCVSFSQPAAFDASLLDWNIKQHRQDANFGALANLQAMVVQTLAAWYTEQHGVPCAWLAGDPHYTLTLGIVEPDDSRS